MTHDSFLVIGNNLTTKWDIKTTTSINYLEESIREYKRLIKDFEVKIKYCKLKINNITSKANKTKDKQ